MEMHTAETQPGHHRLTHRHLLNQRSTVLRRFVARHQHRDLIGPLGQRREPHLQANAGVVPQRNRQHAGGQATQLFVNLHLPGQRLELQGTASIRVKQQNGIAPTRLGIGAQQGAYTPPHIHGSGQRIGDGTRRAHGRAGTATHAQVRVNHNAAALALGVRHGIGITPLLAHGFAFELGIAADGHGGAHINTGRATNLFIAAMGAKTVLIFEKFRFFKHAHHATQLQHSRIEFAGVATRMNVALRQCVLDKSRLVAQIKHHVKGRGALARLTAKLDGTHRVARRHAIAV